MPALICLIASLERLKCRSRAAAAAVEREVSEILGIGRSILQDVVEINERRTVGL